MKFSYHKPQTVDEVISLLEVHAEKARVLAGGTDLLLQLKRKITSPEHLISVKELQELRGVEKTSESIKVGALTTLSALEKDNFFRDECPVLAETASKMASPQIRQLATVGGNICNSSPSADLLPPLIALGTKVNLIGGQGERTMLLEEFFTGPGENKMKKGEVLTGITIPRSSLEESKVCYMRHSIRQGHDIALVGVAVMVKMADDNQVEDAKIVMGAVAPTPVRALEAEDVIKGEIASEALFIKAAQLATAAASPIDDLRASASYRRQIVNTLVYRGLEKLIFGKQGMSA